MRNIIALVALIIYTSSFAETYLDISPVDNLGDVKNRFPNANVEKLSPGWAQATDALYKFTGVGMSGWIVVKFDDIRPKLKEDAENEPDQVRAKFLLDFSQQSDEEAMSVKWVRWVPDNIIPVQRLILKYGKPEKSGFSDENYQPYRSWDKKGVAAYLSDDEKFVERIDFTFTRKEYRKAFFKKINGNNNKGKQGQNKEIGRQ